MEMRKYGMQKKPQQAAAIADALEHAKTHRVLMVWTAVDRVAKREEDLTAVWKSLSSNGVRVVTVDGTDSSTSEGVTMWNELTQEAAATSKLVGKAQKTRMNRENIVENARTSAFDKFDAHAGGSSEAGRDLSAIVWASPDTRDAAAQDPNRLSAARSKWEGSTKSGLVKPPSWSRTVADVAKHRADNPNVTNKALCKLVGCDAAMLKVIDTPEGDQAAALEAMRKQGAERARKRKEVEEPTKSEEDDVEEEHSKKRSKKERLDITTTGVPPSGVPKKNVLELAALDASKQENVLEQNQLRQRVTDLKKQQQQQHTQSPARSPKATRAAKSSGKKQ